MAVRRFVTLQDGSVFEGYGFGFDSEADGEVVFNTGMVGYPEALTDPSYHGQILVLTYPLVGNYGVPSPVTNGVDLTANFESPTIQIRGLVISDYSFRYSHWTATQSLDAWLKANQIPGIYGIDTRALTMKLRDQGVMLGRVGEAREYQAVTDPNTRNLAAEVSVIEPVTYGTGDRVVIAVDCGMKHSIVQNFVKRGVQVKRVPWNYDFRGEQFQGLFISNGPGDPKQCDATVKNVAWALEHDIPTFGICLGSQILGLAAGADTYKLKFGHRSQNQPCLEQGTKRCLITSQNHGYAITRDSLEEGWEEWFVNANDGTNEGIRHTTRPYIAVQFHPEVHPGPTDTEFLFDRFVKVMK